MVSLVHSRPSSQQQASYSPQVDQLILKSSEIIEKVNQAVLTSYQIVNRTYEMPPTIAAQIQMRRQELGDELVDRFLDWVEQHKTLREIASKKAEGLEQDEVVHHLAISLFSYGTCGEVSSLSLRHLLPITNCMFVTVSSTPMVGNGYTHAFLVAHNDVNQLLTLDKKVQKVLNKQSSEDRTISMKNWLITLPLISKEFIIIDPFLRLTFPASSLPQEFQDYLDVWKIDRLLTMRGWKKDSENFKIIEEKALSLATKIAHNLPENFKLLTKN